MESLCVAKPEIQKVSILETGQILTAEEAIGCDYAELEKLRMRLAHANAEGERDYVCPLCNVGVYLACSRHNDVKRFYFKHRIEDGNCPAITRGELTKEEMNARQYNGQKESGAHQRMKQWVAQSLACDPDFSEIEVEKVWRGQDLKSWRKPDVRAVWKGSIPVVFEIQLSTTYLHVIAERRLFYLKEGALLCWIFQSFDADIARMTQDDIFYNNNQNLFLASEETLAQSRATNSFMLNCQWSEPKVTPAGLVEDRWQNRMAAFSELTLDRKNQRLFYFDYERQRQSLLEDASEEGLRRRFELWWCQFEYPPCDDTWTAFRLEFGRHRVSLPEYTSDIRGLLHALYSAKAGKPVGYQYTKLISVAHTIENSYKSWLQYFRAALLAYGRGPLLVSQDKPQPGFPKGKWARKVAEYKSAMTQNDPAYTRDRRYDALIAVLFPEVWARMPEIDQSQQATQR